MAMTKTKARSENKKQMRIEKGGSVRVGGLFKVHVQSKLYSFI